MAAAALHVQTRTQILPSENWDNDYEFQQETNMHPRRRHVGVMDARKLSIASSTALEDWDADEGPSAVPHPPSTPSQAVLHQHLERQTENWDDDFEDGRDSPKKVANASPPIQQREAGWDDDMGLAEESEDDSGEFGFAEKEEDRTVTAKSRRAALKRLSSSSNTEPPLMPPPLSTNFLANIHQHSAHLGPYRTFQQPFPARSPTSSVFSIPTTAHTVQTADHFYSSTTHLRPTSAFALLPPSPPIHKERERRRLRKKSRPKPQGMFELASLRGSSINASESRLGSRSAGPSDSSRNRYSFSDDGDAEPSALEPARPFPDIMRLKAGTPSDTSSADDRRAVTPALTAPSLPQTPAKGNALLSRINSVKKWGARRKRASTTPSEVIADESNNMDSNRTPRVKSSRASFHANVPSGRNSMSTSPPSQEHTASASNPQSSNINLNQNGSGQTSNWFFRASSTGSPHTRAGGRAGRSASSKGNRGKEKADEGDEYQPGSRQRSESSQRRSRTGKIGSYLNGSKTDLTPAHGSIPPTPSKLVKRKSLGFIQLRRSVAAGKGENDEKRVVESEVTDSPRKGRYIGIGIGRATGQGAANEVCEGGASEPEGAVQGGDSRQERPRRKSFSRFLFDRDKENESNTSSRSEAPEREKDGSRGFMGSVRRISLVGAGKHKRTKSGNGILVGVGGKVPPLPSTSPLAQRPAKPPSTNLPYSLPPLPVTASQLSLRLTSTSTSSSGKQLTGSMHDLPTTFSLPTLPCRTVSAASNQTQASNTSSVLPMSSISSRSSRNTTRSELLQQTPRPPQRNASTRSRTSGESARPRKSTSSRRSLDVKVNDDVSFVAKLAQYGDKIKEGDITSPQPISSVSSSAPPLLPPIELQPPSPPRTLTSGTNSKSKPSTILTAFDSSPTSKLSPSASSSSVFFTPSSSPQHHPVGSPSPNSKTSKLNLSPHNGKNAQQSASLGRATAAGSPQDGNGNSGTSTQPRRNSLGDLKIPARISQAQVGLRRDLGMVREFANNIEQLKELQRTYDGLVVEIQSILDAHVVQHEQQQAQVSSTLIALAEAVSASTKRPRSNTTTSQLEPNQHAAVTPAQIAYNELASAFYVINTKYRITWECADLLIELGGGSANGNTNDDISSPPESASAPIVSQLTSPQIPGMQGSIGTNGGRERAITLAGDEQKPAQPPLVASNSGLGSADADCTSLLSSPSNGSALASPPSMSWRTSTGRHDLSQRQLVLLREMLNNAHAHADVADDVGSNSQGGTSVPERTVMAPQSRAQPRILRLAINKEWKWGDPKNSTVTLPSEDSDRFDHGMTSTDYKRRSGKLGMSGLRDLLRALKRSTIVEESTTPALLPAIPVHSTTSLSTESSTGSRRLRKSRHPSQRRRQKTGTGSDSVRSASDNAKGQAELRTTSPYGPSFVPTKSSPRRPSLASIFRIGSKNRSSNTTNGISVSNSGTGEDSSSTEEDWDRMDSASDMDTAAKALGIEGSATVRGGSRRDGRKKRSPYLQQESFAQPTPEQSTDRPLMTKRSFGASQVSIRGIEQQSVDNNFSLSSLRPVRLSNVEEQADDCSVHPSASRSVSQAHLSAEPCVPKSGVSPAPPGITKSGSVRSMPTHVTSATMSPLACKPPLAMTPENIKPLLENAKVVQAKLGDCIAELRALVSHSVGGDPVIA